VIALEGAPGRPLRIGHRGAAALAPENTLRGFRAAVALNVDLIEFDVLELPRGPLVVAHSDHLDEVSHGRAHGSVRARSLPELRELAPELPTLAEALAFFADEAPHVGVHVDLKLGARLDELAAAIVAHGLVHRCVVSGVVPANLRTVARHAPGIRIGLTYPEERLSVSRRPWLWPLVSPTLAAMRVSIPHRLQRLTARAGASAVMLQHKLVTQASVERAHALGLAVVTWTVDELDDLHRVTDAGVDGVVTNDPRIFSAL
jgi:glycerophosphoryl diester phosphodiesterase